jgi:hypothetical protein
MSTTEKIWDLLESLDIANDAEMGLVTDINGYSEETLMDIVYARTGLRSLEQVASEYDVNLEEYGFDEDEIETF